MKFISDQVIFLLHPLIAKSLHFILHMTSVRHPTAPGVIRESEYKKTIMSNKKQILKDLIFSF